MYAPNFVRSAMAPDTIVAAVAANTTWNIQKAVLTSPSSESGLTLDRKNPSVPNHPESLVPNMNPNPTTANASVPTEKSIRFFITMLPAFLARVMPASSIAKPGCIKNTRNAARSIQMMSRATGLNSISLSLHGAEAV